MFPLNLGLFVRIIGGRIVRGKPELPVHHAVYGYTRYVKPGVVHFFRTDRYVSRQLQDLRVKRSSGVVVPFGWQNRIPSHHPVIAVANPHQAVWKLTRWQREQSKALFIGITGSSGKTTTKEMTASVVMQKYRTLKSYANNNVVSCLPGNLMRLNASHQVVVLEMGMADLGNIRMHCHYAKPSIGVVTNVGEAHVGSLGNSLNNVVRAKQELVDGIQPGGTLFLNVDDKGSKRLNLGGFRGKVITFGIDNPARYRATNIRLKKDGMHFRVAGSDYYIPTWGKHNVYNALAAIGIGKLLKVPTPLIQKGLRTFQVPYMRLQRLKGIRGYTLINDSYNANPTSMIAGLRVLKHISDNDFTVAVLGDMYELGAHSTRGHRKVGKVVAVLKPSRLITIGPQAAKIAHAAAANGYPRKRIRICKNMSTALADIRQHVPQNATLYFKASRKVGLEKLVKQLRG